MANFPPWALVFGNLEKKVSSGFAVVLIMAACGLLAISPARAGGPGPEWSVEVGEALQTYREGDYASARAGGARFWRRAATRRSGSTPRWCGP